MYSSNILKIALKIFLIEITAINRGDKTATLHLLPTLWFRNTWSSANASAKPVIYRQGTAIVASHPELGDRLLASERTVPLLFTENETNSERLFGVPNSSPYVKSCGLIPSRGEDIGFTNSGIGDS